MRKYNKVLLILLITSILLPSTSGATHQTKEISMTRLNGSGRIQTAIKVSKEAYPKASSSVVLAGYNGEVDALTGTLLAAAKDAPLLLINKDRIHQDIKEELTRLKVKDVYILGGNAAVNKSVENELSKSYNVKRISGRNREETALEVAKEVNGQSEHIFLAKGYGVLADALSIGPVSGIKDIPVLLTQTDKLPQATVNAIKELGVNHITIVGGEAAISKSVEKQLKGVKTDRINGSKRESTALAIADRFFASREKVLIANGYIFADALVGGYFGALLEAPILLTSTNSLSSSTKGYIKNKVEESIILGGEKAVSNSVYKSIQVANIASNTAYVYNEIELRKSLKDKAVDTINIMKDISLNKEFSINRPITIEGNNKKIIAPDNSNLEYPDYQISTVEVYADNVIINNLTIQNSSFINLVFHNSKGGRLNNVSLKNAWDSALMLNSSQVEINNLTTTNNYWYSIGIEKVKNSNIEPKLTILGTLSHKGLSYEDKPYDEPSPVIVIYGRNYNGGWVINAKGYIEKPITSYDYNVQLEGEQYHFYDKDEYENWGK